MFRRLVTGTIAALLTVAAVGGAPVLLWKVAGNPVPATLPSADEITDLLLSPDNGTLFLKALTWAGWIAWATFTISVLLEVPAQLRGRRARRIPGLRLPQKVAGTLVGAIFAVFLGASVAHAVVAPVPVTAPAPIQTAPAAPLAPAVHAVPAPLVLPTLPPAGQATSAHPDSQLVYVVKQGDYLGRIAERFTGDFDCYRDIAKLNPDLIRNPNHIEPGWKLIMPADSRDRGIMSHATGSVLPPPSAEKPAEPPPPPAPAEKPVVRLEKPEPPGNSAPPAEQTNDDGKSVHAPLAAGAGLAAAGVLAAHVIIHRRQVRQSRVHVRRRRRVTKVFLPDVENVTRQMPKHRAVDRIDAALRTLSVSLRGRPSSDTPDIAAVWQAAGDLAFILAAPCADPPQPFTERWQNTWSLPATVRLPDSHWAPALLPGLLTFATWSQGGELLVDGERTGLLSITGDPQGCDNLLRALAAEAATAQWTDGTSILVAGLNQGDLHNITALNPSRVRAISSIPEALNRISKRAAANASILHETQTADTMTARVTNLTEGFWATHVLFVSDPWGEHTQQLRELDTQLAGLRRVGVAVVATHPTATRWSATVGSDSNLHMAWLAVAGAKARQLTSEELATQVEPTAWQPTD